LLYYIEETTHTESTMLLTHLDELAEHKDFSVVLLFACVDRTRLTQKCIYLYEVKKLVMDHKE